MTATSTKARKPAKKAVVTGFVLSMYFDMNFNFISETEERVTISPDAPHNWEYEAILSIPHIWHKYVHVYKNARGLSSKTLTNKIRQKVKAFVLANSVESGRIDEPLLEEDLQFLENCVRDLNADPTVKKTDAIELPKLLKQLGLPPAKKNRINRRGKAK